jgi:hypothetical protein
MRREMSSLGFYALPFTKTVSCPFSGAHLAEFQNAAYNNYLRNNIVAGRWRSVTLASPEGF